MACRYVTFGITFRQSTHKRRNGLVTPGKVCQIVEC
jgi:hypothetical protein